MAQLRLQQVGKTQRVARHAGARIDAGARVDLEAAAVGAAVAQVLLCQIALVDQVVDQQLLVGGIDLLVHGAALQALGQQFVDVAAHVGLDFELAQPLAAQGAGGVVVVDIGGVVVVIEQLQRHAEAAGVMQGRTVVEGDAPRAEIDVLAALEAAYLLFAAELLEHGAAARRLAAPAGKGARLDHLAGVAKLAHFVGRRHAGQAGAENHHGLSLAAALQDGWRVAGRGEVHAPGFHIGEQKAAAAHGERLGQEMTARGGRVNIEDRGNGRGHGHLVGCGRSRYSAAVGRRHPSMSKSHATRIPGQWREAAPRQCGARRARARRRGALQWTILTDGT